MGANIKMKNENEIEDYGVRTDGYFPAESDGSKSVLCEWMEMWDYVGGIQFRGFVTEKDDEKAMFVFFDQAVLDGDLKAG